MTQIIACPSCRRQLQVPENFLGQLVQCPDCQHQFTAATDVSAIQDSKPAGPAAPAPPRPEERRRRP
ncbi:MAG TPA: hypothetical protein VFE62_16915, partial [Gemmataceae bacterium]|nr:hypothetical protein [Gemmataceae bacterium]